MHRTPFCSDASVYLGPLALAIAMRDEASAVMFTDRASPQDGGCKMIMCVV